MNNGFRVFIWWAALWAGAALGAKAPAPATTPRPANTAYDDAVKTADVEILRLDRTYTLNPDGSWEMVAHEVKRALTGEALNRYLGETAIRFRDTWQQVEIGAAFTLLPNGKKVILPENAKIDIMALDVASHVAFHDLREKVVAHTALEIGAVTDLTYTIKTRKGFLPFFEGLEVFAYPFPIREMEVVVRVPRGTPVTTGVNGTGIACSKATAGATDAFTWRSRNILPVYPDKAAPEPLTWTPWVSFSTAPSDAAVMRLLAPEALPKELAEEVMERVAPSSGAGLTGVAASLKKALDAVLTVDVSPLLTGVPPSAAREPYDRSCGTRLEKARFAASLLSSLGAAETGVAVLVPEAGLSGKADGKPSAAGPAPGFLGILKPLVCFRTASGTYYADTEGFLYTPNDPRWQGLLLVEPDGRRRQPACEGRPPANAWSLNLEVKDWKDKTCRVSGNLALDGTFVNNRSLLGDAKKYAEEVLGDILKPYGLKDMTVLVKVAGPNALEASFEGTAEKLTDAGEGWAIPLPDQFPVPAWKDLLSVPSGRTAPVALSLPTELSLNFRVSLPAGTSVLAGPRSAQWSRDGVDWRQDARTEGNSWIYSRNIRFSKASGKSWGAVADGLAAWTAPSFNCLTLK